MKIIKRSGAEAIFDANKIAQAVKKANDSVVEAERLSYHQIAHIVEKVEKQCLAVNRSLNVEEIQDLVENAIMREQAFSVAQNYVRYRYERELARTHNTTDERIKSILECNNEEVKQENSNKNPTVNSVQRDYIAGEVNKDFTRRFLLPEDIVEAHDAGIIHFHDTDYYAQHMHNCCLINLEDMLQNGTVISETMLEKPKSFSTACNIATQAIAQVASSQYGGQSISLAHLAPFVQISREKFRRMVRKEMEEAGIPVTEEQINVIAEKRVKEEINRGVQVIQYQVITLMTTNGQAPFITVFMYIDEVPEGQTREDLVAIIEEMLHQRIRGVKNEKGVWITPAFPKLIYVLEEDNIHEDSKYYYLTKLAAECSAKRLVPDYISEKVMKELKDGNCYPCMGCRSFLQGWKDENGVEVNSGRMNLGVVTLNLPRIALESKGDQDKFWEIFEERMGIAKDALVYRVERVKEATPANAPILYQYGAFGQRLGKFDNVDQLFKHRRATVSLGYIGLYEVASVFYGSDWETNLEAKTFTLNIVKAMKNACESWSDEYDYHFSVYSTPSESLTDRFCRLDTEKFGVVTDITDKEYYTNSFHYDVRKNPTPFEKLEFEKAYPEAGATGGFIHYCEYPVLQQNPKALEAVWDFAYDRVGYLGTNTPIDKCYKCDFEGDFTPTERGFMCPNCGNTDPKTVDVVKRTCGYLGNPQARPMVKGRHKEISARVKHMNGSTIKYEGKHL